MNESADPTWPQVLHGVAPQKTGGESPNGYLCRVAEANGYSGADTMSLLGIGFASIFEPETSKRISFTLRITEHEWASLAYEEWGREIECRFLGQDIKNEYLCLQIPRICCACLRARSIWWAVWDLKFVVACPLHRCKLLDNCPNCRSLLGLTKRRSVCLCQCGFDFRCHDTSEACEELITVADAIYMAAGFYPETGLENYCPVSFANEALPRKLSELLAVLSRLGSSGRGRPTALIGAVSPFLVKAVRLGSIFSIPAYKKELWLRNTGQAARDPAQTRPC